MTVEVLPCCCAVSPCPCFQNTGGYRVTWTGVIRHDPVGCGCLLPINIPPNYSGPLYETYTLRNPFQSGVPATNKLWVQPSSGSPSTPCYFLEFPVVVFGQGRPIDSYQVGLGGYCSGPTPVDPSYYAASFTATIGLTPYKPGVSKWRVGVLARPFYLVFESDSTNCDPTGFYLVSSSVTVTAPETVSCNGPSSGANIYVSSTLVSEGSVSIVRI